MESLILALIFNLTDKCTCTYMYVCGIGTYMYVCGIGTYMYVCGIGTYMYVCGIGTYMYCKIVWLCFWMYFFIQLTNSACIKPFAFYLNNAALCTNASTHAQATKAVGTVHVQYCFVYTL